MDDQALTAKYQEHGLRSLTGVYLDERREGYLTGNARTGYSQNTSQEIWVRTPDGKEKSFRVTNLGFMGREGNLITVLSSHKKGVFSILNHTSEKSYTATWAKGGAIHAALAILFLAILSAIPAYFSAAAIGIPAYLLGLHEILLEALEPWQIMVGAYPLFVYLSARMVLKGKRTAEAARRMIDDAWSIDTAMPQATHAPSSKAPVSAE